MVENKKIKAMFVFEILGRPPEHVKTTLGELVNKLGELPGIEIFNKKIHEPKPIEKQSAKNLFTSFAEVEVLSDDINNIINLIFHGMPSHVEIIEPQELSLKNFDLSGLLSALTIKLHRYDEIAKTLTIERNVLAGKLNELQEKVGGEGEVKEKAKTEKKDEAKKTKSKKKDDKKSKK